ncbi:MAG: DUF4209 domain-containing protein [Nanoarchaeota archaeon]|nr:DUF4209 domain-containing protein [Nanoarchaeota archaeon]
MNICNQEKIKQIMNTKYEKMYPFELEQSLSSIMKMANENKDEEIKQKILWEIDLINRAFGRKGIYQGQKVTEISNKWEYFLDIVNFKPLSNPPFCEWKKEAVDYYKKRYNQTENNLAKARYAFAIMVFSSGQDKLGWMKKSAENWLKTAEKYVSEGVYNKEYYEVPYFAYEFALKLSLKFSQKEIAKNIFNSLHNNIIKILNSGEQRWHLEFFEVESNYINQFENIGEIKKESVDRLKKIIKYLDENFKKSKDKQKSNHFLRHHLEILSKYKTENEYDLNKKIAESYIEEAEARDEPLVKSSFYNDAIKKYKFLQNSYPDKKAEIEERIENLILKIKEINSKITYKEFKTEFKITNKQIEDYIKHLKAKEADLLDSFLEDIALFPKYEQTKNMTLEQKKQSPLQFIIPIIIYNKEEPIMKITTENEIFDYHIRKNILIGLKISEIMCKMIFEKLEKEIQQQELINKLIELISQDELKDIKKTLETGFIYTFEKKEYLIGLHLIIPYIEEVIRLIIKKAGKVEVVLEQSKTKFFRGIELGGLLSDKNVEGLIGLDFQKSLKVMLVDNDQSNLRNELLHGKLASNKINDSQTLFVAYCLLKLLKILKETKK